MNGQADCVRVETEIRPGVVVLAKLNCGHAYWGVVQWVHHGVCMIGGYFVCFHPGAVVLAAVSEITIFPGPGKDEREPEWLKRTKFPLDSSK